jgi:hypothetical protein
VLEGDLVVEVLVTPYVALQGVEDLFACDLGPGGNTTFRFPVNVIVLVVSKSRVLMFRSI